MPKRSPEYMQQQRLRFCEAAMACFRRKGVVATSLNDICEEAGLSSERRGGDPELRQGVLGGRRVGRETER